MPSLDPGERWTEHNVDAYIPEDIKRMMNRHGKCVFLVRHLQSRHGAGAVFTSNVREAAQRALHCGCGKEELERRLASLRGLIAGMEADAVVLPPGGGDSS